MNGYHHDKHMSSLWAYKLIVKETKRYVVKDGDINTRKEVSTGIRNCFTSKYIVDTDLCKGRVLITVIKSKEITMKHISHNRISCIAFH